MTPVRPTSVTAKLGLGMCQSEKVMGISALRSMVSPTRSAWSGNVIGPGDVAKVELAGGLGADDLAGCRHPAQLDGLGQMKAGVRDSRRSS